MQIDDLSSTMYAPELHEGVVVRAIGWLGKEVPTRGRLGPTLLDRLRHYRHVSFHDDGDLGSHVCELCGKARGHGEFWIPSGGVRYVLPDLVIHYCEAHDYLPPSEFLLALRSDTEHAQEPSGARGSSMRIEGNHRHWDATDDADLGRVLCFRDSVGGAQFWLRARDREYPLLAIRISGELSDVHYFPEIRHPGFRALAPSALPELGSQPALFRYEGADPASGEEVPSRFVLEPTLAVRIACEFYRTQDLPESTSWLEL